MILKLGIYSYQDDLLHSGTFRILLTQPLIKAHWCPLAIHAHEWWSIYSRHWVVVKQVFCSSMRETSLIWIPLFVPAGCCAVCRSGGGSLGGGMVAGCATAAVPGVKALRCIYLGLNVNACKSVYTRAWEIWTTAVAPSLPPPPPCTPRVPAANSGVCLCVRT